ncbi:MAG: hypothetical protein KGI78_00735 [Patescibacteria group bacterium]|nr:hypothetical protein [Patescibacteria group bacterium]MDE1944335.1 hypothetical protein [Patescibacteria group bacterium]MDE1944679.1 hypothetical protein [Patescibacteria group bacterium]MDE2057365.1 hypothetical protein [Patescibacteria group bacterium]
MRGISLAAAALVCGFTAAIAGQPSVVELQGYLAPGTLVCSQTRCFRTAQEASVAFFAFDGRVSPQVWFARPARVGRDFQCVPLYLGNETRSATS